MRMRPRNFMAAILIYLAVLSIGCHVVDRPMPGAATRMLNEDGYQLWLRYAPPGKSVDQYLRLIRLLVVDGDSATSQIIRKELSSALKLMFGSAVPVSRTW